MRTIRRRVSVTAIAAAGLLALVGCADSGTPAPEPTVAEDVEFEPGTTMARLADAGSITIGTKFDQPGFGLIRPDGTPIGFDVEIGKIIAGALGIAPQDIKWVEAVSANREPYIQNGQVDIVVATYTINDTRKAVVDFAGPYYTAGQDLLVLAGNPLKIKGPDDLADKKVCTVTGSTSERNIAEYPNAGIDAALTYSACLEPLRKGDVAAVTTDNVILIGLADQNPGEFNQFTSEPYGIGLKLGDQPFRDFINDVLEQSFEDGTWESAWESTAGEFLPTPEPPSVDRY